MTSNRKRLLVPHHMPRAGWAVLEAREDVEAVGYEPMIARADFHALLRDAAGVALTPNPAFGAGELAAAPALRVVARIGVGFDSVDVAALTDRRIPLMVIGTANSVTVAEHALFLMMALAKRGALMEAMVREGRWMDKFKHRTVELYGKTLLVIGFGRIGTRIAARCRALEMSILVFDPYVPAAAVRAAGFEAADDLDAALARADIVTIHCPRNAETAGMFGAARLARMKPSAFLINTARGGIVDEAALHAALTAGRLAGAGLDVFDQEPPPRDHPLLALPNVAIAPHAAGNSVESGDRGAIATARNLLSVLDGDPIRENVVNPQVLA